MKKGRALANEADLPPQRYLAAGEDDKAWFRLQNLRQDYEDLLKDTEAKKKRLNGAKQRALKLKGEIRFLRRRYKLLTHTASPTVYRPKSHPNSSSNSIKHKEKAANPALPILDLNQASLPETEEEAEFNNNSEARAKESARKYLIRQDPTPSRRPNLPFPSSSPDVALNTPSCSVQRGKRKVSWQDQLALKV